MENKTLIDAFAIRLLTHAHDGNMKAVDEMVKRFADGLNGDESGHVVLERLQATLAQPEYGGGDNYTFA